MHILFITMFFNHYCFRQHSMNKTINVTKYPIRRITAKGAIWVRLIDLAWLGSHCSSVFIVQCNIIFWCKIPSSLILNIWKLNNLVNGQFCWKIIPRNINATFFWIFLPSILPKTTYKCHSGSFKPKWCEKYWQFHALTMPKFMNNFDEYSNCSVCNSVGSNPNIINFELLWT